MLGPYHLDIVQYIINSFSTETAKLFLTFCQSRCFTYSALLRTSYLMAVLFFDKWQKWQKWQKVLSRCKDKLWWRAKTRWKSRAFNATRWHFPTLHTKHPFSHTSLSHVITEITVCIIQPLLLHLMPERESTRRLRRQNVFHLLIHIRRTQPANPFS